MREPTPGRDHEARRTGSAQAAKSTEVLTRTEGARAEPSDLRATQGRARRAYRSFSEQRQPVRRQIKRPDLADEREVAYRLQAAVDLGRRDEPGVAWAFRCRSTADTGGVCRHPMLGEVGVALDADVVGFAAGKRESSGQAQQQRSSRAGHRRVGMLGSGPPRCRVRPTTHSRTTYARPARTLIN
jgi:hypothetical protein